MIERLTLDPLPLVLPEKKVPLQKCHFLLGADDREMRRICQILQRFDLAYSYALHDGARVHAGNAYEADPVRLPAGTVLVLIECGLRDLTGCEGVILRRIDHHNKNDKGYHLSADRFWEASSLGQVYTLLQLGSPTKEDLIIAARDHCMFDAMMGKCPGVHPADVMLFSLQSIAEEKGVTTVEVELTIRAMRKEIMRAPVVTIGNQSVTDLRHLPSGIGYSVLYLSIREALAQAKQAGLIRNKNDEHGADKIIMCGALPNAIDDFRSTWGPEQGLHNFFSVPARGYAGGFKIP